MTIDRAQLLESEVERLGDVVDKRWPAFSAEELDDLMYALEAAVAVITGDDQAVRLDRLRAFESEIKHELLSRHAEG
jgi:hypothetical protein